MDRRFFVLAALALTGCATGVRVSAPAPGPAPPSGPKPGPPPSGARLSSAPLQELEPLYAATAGREVLTITVASNGCTSRGDFTFYVDHVGGATRIAFARKRVDSCKSFAMGRISLNFSWAELGVPQPGPVFLLNPVTAWTGPGG